MLIDIPGFSIVSTLNEDVQASVYLALDQASGREVALKVIPAAALEPSAQAALVARARQSLCRLSHPNIVNILGVGMSGRHCFLTMEYLPGSHLNHKCFELDFIERLRIVIDLAQALQYLDDQGYVHGALTPWNVLVLPPRNRGVLLGFSLGVQPNRWLMDSSIDQGRRDGPDMSQVAAAAHYASPEQLRGKPLDLRSDLYSLGVILFFLLTDSLPFAGASLDELAAQGESLEVPQLPEYLQAFQPIIDRLLVNNIAARYSSARECLAELEALPESVIWQASEKFDEILMTRNEVPARLTPASAAMHLAEGPTILARRQEPLAEDLETLKHQWDGVGLRADQPAGPSEPLTIEPLHPEPILDFFTPSSRLNPVNVKSAIAVLLVIVAGLYFTNSNIQVGQAVVSAHGDPANVPAPAQTRILSFPAEPGLEEQAAVLRAQVQKNFNVATDLMVIYRAALRGDSPQEQAFAKQGLNELQVLFSERILAWAAANEVEKMQREMALARQLFETEELQPVLARALAAAE